MSVESDIYDKLHQTFAPEWLRVENESHRHAGPPDAESHFKVTLVASGFAGKRAVQRHQAVYGALQEELDGPVHALSIHAYTPEEWPGSVRDSPDCMGQGR